MLMSVTAHEDINVPDTSRSDRAVQPSARCNLRPMMYTGSTHIRHHEFTFPQHELVIVCEIAVSLVFMFLKEHLYRSVPQRRIACWSDLAYRLHFERSASWPGQASGSNV